MGFFAFRTAPSVDSDRERTIPVAYILTDATMATTTQKAWTKDQISVLTVADENPDATPQEIAEMIDDEHIGSDYVTSILDGFHLPENPDKPDSEAGKRVDGQTDGGDVIEVDIGAVSSVETTGYRCVLCDDTFEAVGAAKSHIVSKTDDKHEERSATDDTHLIEPIGDGAHILNRLNRHPDVEDVLTDEHFHALCAIVTHPEASVSGIAERIGIKEGTLYNRLADMGLSGEGSTNRDERADMARTLLDESGIELQDTDDDTTEDTVTIEHDREDDELELTTTDTTQSPTRLELGDDKSNTEAGGWYEAVVNNVEPYGVFCTLAQGPNGGAKGDLSGLAHKSNIPNFFTPRDYEAGDRVVVERLPDEVDGNLTLRMVSDDDGEIFVDGPLDAEDAPEAAAEANAGDTTTDEEERADERVSAENQTGAYEGPAEGIDMTEQHISERPTGRTENGQEAFEAAEAFEEVKQAVETLASYLDELDREAADVPEDVFTVEEAEHMHSRFDMVQEALGTKDGGPDEGKFETVISQLDALEAAVTHKDSRDPDKPFTLHLGKEQIKTLVRDAPEEVSDMALDALAEGAE